LHFSHIGLTDGRTFMSPFSKTGGNAPGHLNSRRKRDQ
jgi:hypothetical protein